MRTSRLVTKITGISVQPNKAIVGANAFAHEAGIHQDGLLKDKSTYEIIRPESVGVVSSRLVMGKHSGRHAFRARLEDLGYQLNPEELDSAFQRFKDLADQKKEIYDEDLEALVNQELEQTPEYYSIIDISTSSGINQKPTATIKLQVGDEVRDRMEHGDGQVDAAYRAISALTETKSRLQKFEVKGITGGTDALGEVTVTLEEDDRTARGMGADTDIIVAAAKAYVNALNRLKARKK